MSRDFNTTSPPRPGEELDASRLAKFLGRGEVAIEQFPAGHSNLTYLVRAADEEWVLRRPPFGSKVKSAHDMGREYRILSTLHRVYQPAPEPIAYCDDPEVLGAPFYLMKRLRGVVIRRAWPEQLPPAPAVFASVSGALVDNLAALHAIDLEAAGLAGFGKPEGYVRRQIEGWSKRWLDARTEEIADMSAVADWLAGNMPAESGASIVHNDYKLDNVIFNPDCPGEIVGVLDWEMATVGDPLMDMGTSISYWIDGTDAPEFQAIAFSPTHREGFPTRREWLERYQESSGREVRRPEYYYAYGLFKLAVILQQIYYRYVHGLTGDARFAKFGRVVEALARQAARAVDAGSIEPGR